MINKLLFTFSTLALAAAFAASSYTVRLYDPSVVNGKTLKAGEYKVQVTADAVILKNGRDTTEAPAKTELAERKFNETTLRYNDNHELQEIRIGGTNKRIVLKPGATANGGAL